MKLALTITLTVILMFISTLNMSTPAQSAEIPSSSSVSIPVETTGPAVNSETISSAKCGWVGTACAHRGDLANAPENTIPAFVSAVDNNSLQIELDVRLSSDNYMVIMHDKTVDRTTNGTGEVASLTFAQLRALDAGSWFAPEFAGTQIPTLEEALNVIPVDILVNVHIKKYEAAPMAAQLIESMGRLDQCFLACDATDAAAARAVVADIMICNMGGSRTPGTSYVDESIAMGAEFVQFKTGMYDPDLKSDAKYLHDAGIIVNYCCADNDAEFEALAQAGVDYVLTNYLTTSLDYYSQYSIPQIHGDCDCDDDVDFNDFAILAFYWMELWPIGDFASADGEGFTDSVINYHDLGVFASHWLETLEE